MAAAKPAPVPGYPPAYDAIPSLEIPAGLELLTAHWFFRHGERTPVRQRLAHLGIPTSWNLCAAARESATPVLNDPEDGQREKTELMLLQRRYEHATGNSPRLGGPDECLYGQLTDLGRQSATKLGVAMRRLYVDKLAFIPKILNAEDEGLVHFRCTPVPRAFESLQQALHGLYPRQSATYVPTVVVRSPNDESLYPNTACPTLRELDRFFTRKAAEQLDDSLLAPLDNKLEKVVGVPVRIQSHPSANGVFDTIKASQAHGIDVPKIFKDKSVTTAMETAIVQEWFMGYESRQFTRLAMGRLLGDLTKNMHDRILNPVTNKLRLALYACHDTSIGGILNALQCFDGKWPAFTSYVSVELFQRNKESNGETSSWLSSLVRSNKQPALSEYFVRLRYDSRDMKIPACAPAGKHLEGSEAFQEAVKDIVMSAEEWEAACKSPPATSQ